MNFPSQNVPCRIFDSSAFGFLDERKSFNFNSIVLPSQTLFCSDFFCSILFIISTIFIFCYLELFLHFYKSAGFLHDSLCIHCIYYFLKACNIGTCHIISFHTVFFRCVCHIVANVDHDSFQLAVHLFKGPA